MTRASDEVPNATVNIVVNLHGLGKHLLPQLVAQRIFDQRWIPTQFPLDSLEKEHFILVSE